jgi:hypothetical protein
MKLRMHGNSLRFRLSPSEVATLASEGKLEESVQITPAASDLFIYVLETSAQCQEVRAWRCDCKLGVTLPEQLVRSWAASDQVGIEQTQPVGAGAHLRITVEKDFDCLHPGTHDPKEHNFPRSP